MTASTAAPNNPTLPAPLNQPNPKTQADWQQILNQLASWQQGLGTLIPPYQQTPAEQAAGVTPTNYGYLPGDVRRYGCDITGKTDCTVAVNTALSVYAQVHLPPGTYLIDGTASGGVITIPINSSLTADPGTVTFNITANAGSIAMTSSAFQLIHHSMVSGLIINYPGQTLEDLVASIVQYPPTFTINPANNANYGGYCHIRDVVYVSAYVFSSVQSQFYDCFWVRCTGNAISRGFDWEGANVQMGDTSRVTDCEAVMVSVFGFNAGPLNTWSATGTNAIGVYGSCQGGNRIDGIIFSNTNVIGGSIGWYAGPACWYQMTNCTSDSVTQCALVSAGQMYMDLFWGSAQQGNLPTRQIPAVRCATSGILKIVNSIINLQSGGAQNALCVDSGVCELSAVKFSTSKGGFAPCIFNSSGIVHASGCTVQAGLGLTVNGERPLAWRDVMVGFVGSGQPDFSIDGKTCMQGSAGVISLTNFNMATWVGGVPSNWTTSVGTPANYFQNLNPVDGNTGIQFSGAGSGPGAQTLSYALPAFADDLFGYYLLTGQIKIIDPGSAPSTIFYVTMTDGSGAKVYQVDLAWPGSSAETLAFPTGIYFNFGVMLCAPAGTALGKVVFNFNYQNSTNLIIRIANLNLFGMQPAPECSGQEYWNAQTGGVPRDVQLGPNRRLLRAAAPTSGVWTNGDVAVNNASPASGVTEWRWTSSTWTGLTIP